MSLFPELPAIWVVSASFLALFIGFAWGRRYGKREGFSEGATFAPLDMRRRMWQSGRCAICGSTTEEAARGEDP